MRWTVRLMRIGSPRCASGFTYLALLFAIAVMGVVLAGAGQVWHTAAKREKERELLFIGNQFREAIGRYYENSPGAKQFPAKLEDLVEDKRFPKSKRHLRKIYIDPMTRAPQWGLVQEQGRITGVYSHSTQPPLKTGNFDNKADEQFARAKAYKEWRFVYQPGAGGSAGAETAPAREEGAAAAGAKTPLVPGPETLRESTSERTER